MTARTAARIAALLADGMDIRTAFDSVLGSGAYDAFAANLYDTLKTTEVVA